MTRNPVRSGRQIQIRPRVDFVTQLKCMLWFCAVLLMALSFPIQVYTMSPYPSLLPYALMGVIIVLQMLPVSQGIGTVAIARRSSNIGLMVGIYVFLLLANTAWQAALEVISASYAMNALAIYFLPVAWYMYFRKAGSEPEIRSVLIAIAVAGLIVGIYFAYDSYVKLALGEVSDYNLQALQYSIDRSDITLAEVNDARARLNNRSYGLLQTHAVSGAWVGLGTFASLALLPANFRLLRRTTIAAFGTMVMLGLNFTAIVTFAIVMFLLEFGGLSLVRGRRTEILKNIVPLMVVAAVLVGASYRIAGEMMSEWISYYFSNQADFALGTGQVERGLILGAFDSIGGYLEHSTEYPLTLLFGDGFSTWGLPKGGDTGFTESMARFGILFYVMVVFGLLGLVQSGLRQVKAMSVEPPAPIAALDPRRILRFAMCVTLLVLITDLHYSVWTAKSILPLVFFVLALFERYLTVPRRVSFLGI